MKIQAKSSKAGKGTANSEKRGAPWKQQFVQSGSWRLRSGQAPGSFSDEYITTQLQSLAAPRPLAMDLDKLQPDWKNKILVSAALISDAKTPVASRVMISPGSRGSIRKQPASPFVKQRKRKYSSSG